MTAEITLIESGIDLLMTGMSVVFFFLMFLILSIHALRISCSFLTPKQSTTSLKQSVSLNSSHKKVITEIVEHIRA